MLERDGSVLLTTGPVRPSDARLRRAQALAHQSGISLRIARELISRKLVDRRKSLGTSSEISLPPSQSLPFALVYQMPGLLKQSASLRHRLRKPTGLLGAWFPSLFLSETLVAYLITGERLGLASHP